MLVGGLSTEEKFARRGTPAHRVKPENSTARVNL